MTDIGTMSNDVPLSFLLIECLKELLLQLNPFLQSTMEKMHRVSRGRCQSMKDGGLLMISDEDVGPVVLISKCVRVGEAVWHLVLLYGSSPVSLALLLAASGSGCKSCHIARGE